MEELQRRKKRIQLLRQEKQKRARDSHANAPSSTPRQEVNQTKSQVVPLDRVKKPAKKQRLSIYSLFLQVVEKQERQRVEQQMQCERPRTTKSLEPINNSFKHEDHQKKQQPLEKSQQSKRPQQMKELDEQQRNQTLGSQNFQDFFARSIQMLLKAVDGPQLTILEDALENDNLQLDDNQEKLTLGGKFYDSHYTQGRVVTEVAWSPFAQKGQVLASYSRKHESSLKDEVGVLLLWSLTQKARPESYCFSQSEITASSFNPYNCNQIVGGCYNGQLQLWDLRASRTPVLRTVLGEQGHKFPVYNLHMVGSSLSHQVVSACNDGRVCTWDLKSFNLPVTCQVLVEQNKSEINVTSLEMEGGQSRNYYFGTEAGSVGTWSLEHESDAPRNYQYRTGHQSQITALSLNRFRGDFAQLFSGLLLSSSLDWTVKLWNEAGQFIWTFDYSQDYVYQVDWNPSNPALFSCCNNEGFVDLWNLSYDFDVPVVHIKANECALNKMRWSADGTKLLLGDSQGTLSLLSLAQSLKQMDTDRLSYLTEMLNSSQRK